MRDRRRRPGAVSSIAVRQYESGLWRAKIETLHARSNAQRQAVGGRGAALLHVFDVECGRDDLLFARLYRALPRRGTRERVALRAALARGARGEPAGGDAALFSARILGAGRRGGRLGLSVGQTLWARSPTIRH